MAKAPTPEQQAGAAFEERTRKDFEHWYLNRWPAQAQLLGRVPDGEEKAGWYSNLVVQAAWVAWCASQASFNEIYGQNFRDIAALYKLKALAKGAPQESQHIADQLLVHRTLSRLVTMGTAAPRRVSR